MLTERELDVLHRRATGENQEHIARALKISQAAVSKFETNAQKKLVDATETLERTRSLARVVEGTTGKRVVYGGGKR